MDHQSTKHTLNQSINQSHTLTVQLIIAECAFKQIRQCRKIVRGRVVVVRVKGIAGKGHNGSGVGSAAGRTGARAAFLHLLVVLLLLLQRHGSVQHGWGRMWVVVGEVEFFGVK